MINNLFERFARLVKFLKKYTVTNTTTLPTHQEIFEYVDPLLANIYRRINCNKIFKLEDRY